MATETWQGTVYLNFLIHSLYPNFKSCLFFVFKASRFHASFWSDFLFWITEMSHTIKSVRYLQTSEKASHSWISLTTTWHLFQTGWCALFSHHQDISLTTTRSQNCQKCMWIKWRHWAFLTTVSRNSQHLFHHSVICLLHLLSVTCCVLVSCCLIQMGWSQPTRGADTPMEFGLLECK